MSIATKLIFAALGVGTLIAAGYLQRKNGYVYGTVINKRCDGYRCSAVVEYNLSTKREAEIETTKVEKGQIISLEYDKDDVTEVRACCFRTRIVQGLALLSVVFLYVAYFGSKAGV